MKIIPLTTPIPYGKDADGNPKELAEITLRKPNAGDLRGVKLRLIHDMDTAVLFAVLPRIASPVLTASHVEALDPADIVNVFGVLGDFFQPATAATPSPTMS